MKVAIRADGLLFLAAETELEAFALREWSATNLPYDRLMLAHPAHGCFSRAGAGGRNGHVRSAARECGEGISKGTIRLPASAITGGRVGTARIRDEIAGAARELADATPAPLDRALASLTASSFAADYTVHACAIAAPSPRERMQQLGRQARGRMNKTEAAYAQLLEARRALGEIREFKFESVKLRLADRTWYTPDFWVDMADGSVQVHEVKGRWQDDARVKIKVAAELYPRYRFIAIQRDGRHGWRTEDLTSRSW